MRTAVALNLPSNMADLATVVKHTLYISEALLDS